MLHKTFPLIFSFFAIVPLDSMCLAQSWSISGVNIVDVEAGSIASNRTVVIENDRIAAVRDSNDLDDAAAINGKGLYLIPSLFDCHVHWNQPMRDGLLFAGYGVGFVRDMGGANRDKLVLRRRAESGDFFGVRCRITGAILDGDNPYHPAISIVCNTPEAGVAAVRRQKSAGVDFIKAYSRLQPEVFRAICEEAAKQGMRVVGHVPETTTVQDAARWGMLSNEHLSRVETLIEEAIPEDQRPKERTGFSPESPFWKLYLRADGEILDRSMAATSNAGMFQCPTLVMLAGYGRIKPSDESLATWKRFASAEEFSSWKEKPQQWAKEIDATAANWTRFLDMVDRMDKASVKLVAGTDLGNPYSIAGYSIHDELYYLTAAGLSNEKAIACATINAAQLLGVDSDYGSLKPGKLACFVALAANPLENVRNTLAIDSVTLLGQRMDRNRLDAMLAEAESFQHYLTPGEVKIPKSLPEGELVSKHRYTHYFGDWEVGDEGRLLFKQLSGFATRTVNFQSTWGKVPVLLDQIFDLEKNLQKAEWSVFSKTPWHGSLILTTGTSYEYSVTRGSRTTTRLVSIPVGTMVQFPVGHALEPILFDKTAPGVEVPLIAFTFDGEPETALTFKMESDQSEPPRRVVKILQRPNDSDAADSFQRTITTDGDRMLLEESRTQNGLVQSLKRKD
jgi:imidazolonepropionase-like amidohydrolase